MKTVLITGASGNLGSVATPFFLSKGYRVIAVVSREESKAHLTAHSNLDIVVVDLSNSTETAKFVNSTIEKYKKIDGALLLAGGFAAGDINSSTIDQIHDQITLNFETAYNVTRPLFKHMIDQNYGRVVLIGSKPAIQAVAGKNMIAYGLSKSLLFKLAEYLNSAAKGKNVTVTVAVPSTLDTKENRKSMPDAEYSEWVKPENFVEIVEFIMSEKGASFRETVLKIYNNA
jgi:NADP-dependent 3-hydroxy acid dehydrogenase YdfG